MLHCGGRGMWVHPSHQKSFGKIMVAMCVLLATSFVSYGAAQLYGATLISDYLSLHSFLETFTVVIAALIFSVGWNAYRRGLPSNTLLIACAFLGVAILDFAHMMSYTGMPDFVTPSSPTKAILFWLAARLLASSALAWVVVMPWRPLASPLMRYLYLAGIFVVVAAIMWLVLLHEHDFPVLFIPGLGLTPLKVYAEYAIVLINIISAVVVVFKMRHPLPFNAAGVLGVLCTMSVSELFFVRYIALEDTINLLGHLYKMAGYVFLYYAIFVETIEHPYSQLQRSQHHLQAILNAMPEILLEVGLNGRVYYSHHAGLTKVTTPKAGQLVRDVLTADAAAALMGVVAAIHGHGSADSQPILHEGRWFAVSASRKTVAPGHEPLFIVMLLDITERKQAEAELRVAATAFESQEGILITDAEHRIIRVNGAFTAITGYEAQDVLGQTPDMLNSGHQDQAFFSDMWSVVRLHGVWRGEVWQRRKTGEVFPLYQIITAVRDQVTGITNYVLSVADISQQKKSEEDIYNLAYFDSLTQLPNRRLLLDRLGQAAAASFRSQIYGALVFIDMDNFKTLNDTLGHGIGDLLLQQVAWRLESCVRVGDTVARFGGDEFVLLLEDLDQDMIEAAQQVEAICTKVLATVSERYDLDGHKYFITPSIGATVFLGGRGPIDDLLKQADIALYQAKSAGRNTVSFFDPQMQEAIRERTLLERELHLALDMDQLVLYYQVQVDDACRPVGAEALIRWLHPQRGLVPPGQFISLAEETGLIAPIGQWVLEQACAQLQQWENDPLTCDLAISVNVSARQFRQAGFAGQVHEMIRRYGIDPGLLKLELTESMLVEDIDQTIVAMNGLKQTGVHLSLDDFGTGYSSLQYLKRLPLEQLKIDQSFVRDLDVDESDRAIVNTIVAMAQNMDMDVISEGVETPQQWRALQKMGCHHHQGYLFSRPIPVGQFMDLIRQMPLAALVDAPLVETHTSQTRVSSV